MVHAWKLPDGYDARVKVMVKKETRIEVQELNGASFTYIYEVNEGTKTGLSNAANVVHSVDAYVLREMHRRCNYNKELIEQVDALLKQELDCPHARQPMNASKDVAYYLEQYERSSLASAVILPYINSPEDMSALSYEHIKALYIITQRMLSHKPFPLVTVHDEFKAHANNINQVRYHYKEILAEIADSDVLADLLGQLYGCPGTYDKLTFNLGDKIRNSEYALC